MTMCKTSVCFTSVCPLSLAATHNDPHRTSACCAGQVFVPSPLLGLFLILTGWSSTRGNTSQIVETFAHLRQAETQTSNPCGGPNPLACTNEDILMSGLFARV